MTSEKPSHTIRFSTSVENLVHSNAAGWNGKLVIGVDQTSAESADTNIFTDGKHQIDAFGTILFDDIVIESFRSRISSETEYGESEDGEKHRGNYQENSMQRHRDLARVHNHISVRLPDAH